MVSFKGKEHNFSSDFFYTNRIGKVENFHLLTGCGFINADVVKCVFEAITWADNPGTD